MNIYVNTLHEIAASGSRRMTETKMVYEFSQNPAAAIQKTNTIIWGGADVKTCASLLFAISGVCSPRFHEGIRACLEAALWHPSREVAESAAGGLVRLNDASSVRALADAAYLHPDSQAFPRAIEMLLKPL